MNPVIQNPPTPEIGKTYRVTHPRLGRFEMRITNIFADGVEGRIVSGRYAGSKFPLRTSLCRIRCGLVLLHHFNRRAFKLLGMAAAGVVDPL
jgi:hypothetical protein